MLAYSAEELILDPFAGAVFGFSPGASTRLSSLQHGGVLVGMMLVAIAGPASAGRVGSLRAWMALGGCLASAACACGLAFAGLVRRRWPLQSLVLLLGIANGAFSIAAIGSMMALAGSGRRARRACAWACGAPRRRSPSAGGSIAGSCAAISRAPFAARRWHAYAVVFAGEAALFFVAAVTAARMYRARLDRPPRPAARVRARRAGGVTRW